MKVSIKGRRRGKVRVSVRGKVRVSVRGKVRVSVRVTTVRPATPLA